ncbi:MAG: hypothetical protein ACOX4L_02920 [Bacillota bacterium]|jgi:hypothetical protein
MDGARGGTEHGHELDWYPFRHEISRWCCYARSGENIFAASQNITFPRRIIS